MAIFLIIVLFVIIIILAVICIHRGAQVTSLKDQVDFLEYSLEQLKEKEKGGNGKTGPFEPKPHFKDPFYFQMFRSYFNPHPS